MRLVIFDIDGTLTETMKVDEECFVRSLADVCGFNDIETDWSSYRHTTDPGIFHEIHEARTSRPPSDAEVSRFRRYFIALLERASSETPFVPVNGAPQLLARLAQSAGHRVSLATGAWRDSARLKMAGAGMSFEDYPSASGDDAHDRESIIRLSRQRAEQRHGGLDGPVYVGDGIWDARACRNLGVPFIGIASGVRATRLAAEGAAGVFPDFSDADSFLRCLGEIENIL